MKKTAVIILTIMLIFVMSAVAPSDEVNAESVTTKSISVPANGTYKIFGTFVKTVTSNKVYAKNYSGYGEFGYCYGKVTAKIGSNPDYVPFSSVYSIYKNDSTKTITLYNTLDANNRVCLKVTGASSQTTTDTNRISFYY